MSLQGTLETIPLADVLVLLAATRKTGELRISSPRGDGRLWLDGGLVVDADVPRASTPVDAVFELLRLSAGTFTFGAGSAPKGKGEPQAVDILLAEAQQRLAVWQAIEAVVPSTACTLRLIPELVGEQVTVSRQQWKQLVAVASGGDVNGVMKTLGLGEFETCRTVKELVDAGLVQVGKPPATPVRPAESARPAPPAATARSERTKTDETPTPARRPAPVPGSSRATAATPNASRTTPAAPAASANGGRSAAPRRGPAGAAPAEEADELVQQLSSIGSADAATPNEAVPVKGGPEPEKAVGDDEENGERNGDEPINRGMLLKFLSSVRP